MGVSETWMLPERAEIERSTDRRHDRILGSMPVIIVGADTDIGTRIVDAMVEPEREVRAFVSDPLTAERLRVAGVKVALGDVSDPSHIGGACTHCFSVVLVTEAASDGRERAFAASAEVVFAGWAEAVRDAAVTRVIWVTDRSDVPVIEGVETAVVHPGADDPVAEVVRLDNAATI